MDWRFEYKEQIARDAFTDCKMDDVILITTIRGVWWPEQETRPCNLLMTRPFIEAGLTEQEGRSLISDIKNDYIDRMSSIPDRSGSVWLSESNMDGTQGEAFICVSAVDIPAWRYIHQARKDATLEAEAQVRRQRWRPNTRAELEIKLKLSGGNQ